MPLDKSLMQIIKSLGLNSLPWGTPLVTFSQFVRMEFTRIRCLLCDKNYLIQSNTLSLIP